MKQYSITITWLQVAGYPTDAMYTITSEDSKKACRDALDLARAQFPQSNAFAIKYVGWDGNSAVL